MKYANLLLSALILICFAVAAVMAADAMIPAAIGIILTLATFFTRQRNESLETDDRSWEKEVETHQNKIKEQQSTINTLTAELEEVKKENQRNSEFIVKVQNTSSVEGLASTIIKEVSKELECSQGLFFVTKELEGEPVLEMIAGYAYQPKEEEEVKRFAFSEGLTGEAAANKQIIHLDNIPEGHLEMVSGLGKSSTGHLIILPLISGEQCIGVIELASFSGFSERAISFLTTLAQNVSAKMDALNHNG